MGRRLDLTMVVLQTFLTVFSKEQLTPDGMYSFLGNTRFCKHKVYISEAMSSANFSRNYMPDNFGLFFISERCVTRKPLFFIPLLLDNGETTTHVKHDDLVFCLTRPLNKNTLQSVKSDYILSSLLLCTGITGLKGEYSGRQYIYLLPNWYEE